MSPWKFVLYGALPATVAVQTALAGQVVEVVTLKLKAGVAAAEFAPIDKAVEREHVAKQPGFVSRESAHGADGERQVIVHWRSAFFADASMASFQKAPAAAQFMSRIEAIEDGHEARPRVAFGMAGTEATLKTGADLRAPAAGPSPSWPRPSAHSLRKKLLAAPTSRLTRSAACVRFEVSQQ